MSMKSNLAGWTERVAIDEQTLRTLGLYAVMYGTAFLFVVPYLYMVATSVMPRDQVIAAVPHLIPREITFRWYEVLIQDTLIISWTVNTFIIAGVTTLLILAIDSMIAYSLTRLEWPGQRIVLSVIVASFMVPAIVNLVPLFTIAAKMGLIDSYLGVILPLAAGPLGVFMLVQFFKDIPDELEEAAILDGFSRIQIFTRIVLPLMKPALAALGIFIFISTWNKFVWPLVILQGEPSYTLPVGLVTLQANMGTTEPGIIMASTIVATLPLFVVFLVLQNSLVNAVQMQGAVK